MAPERLLDQHVGRPADVYALACILFELLTGAQPFTGDTATVVHGHVHGPCPRCGPSGPISPRPSTPSSPAAPPRTRSTATRRRGRGGGGPCRRDGSGPRVRPGLASPRPSLLGRAPHRHRRTGSGVRPSRRRCTRPGWRRPRRRRRLPVVAGAAALLLGDRLRGRRRTLPGHRDRGRRGPAVGRGDHRSAPGRGRPGRHGPGHAGARDHGAGDHGAGDHDGTGRLAAPSAVGTWIGTYRCGQGQTGLRLVVTGDDPDSLAAAFRFFPVADNPGVPSGASR